MAMTKYAVDQRELDCGPTKVILLANGKAMVKTAAATFDAEYQEEGEFLRVNGHLPPNVMKNLTDNGYTVSDKR